MTFVKKTHCAHGHEWVPETTFVRKSDGARMCRICMRDQQNRRNREEARRKRELFGPKRNGAPALPPEERFWPKVEIRGEDDCWEWTKSKKNAGYGVFYDGEKTTTAHRFALRLKLGRPLTSVEESMHTCDNPSCCNPAHLVLGTRTKNMQDKVAKGRHHNQIKSRCPRGHPYDMIRKTKTGISRWCRTCKSESTRKNRLSQLLKEDA